MLQLNQQQFNSRLLLGTANYPSLECLKQVIHQSKIEIVTVGLRRQNPKQQQNQFWQAIQQTGCQILPNTAGCRTAKEAVMLSHMARELFSTNWIKLEVIGDDYSLQPDPFELVKAAVELNQAGFFVMPFCTDDIVLGKRLLDAGCHVLMPWAAPIGSGQGIINEYALAAYREQFSGITLIVDAGIGRPSDALKVMEMGYDAVLLNTAVANALNPVLMAASFSQAIQAGCMAATAGIMPKRNIAVPSTPVLDTPFWLQGLEQ